MLTIWASNILSFGTELAMGVLPEDNHFVLDTVTVTVLRGVDYLCYKAACKCDIFVTFTS